MPRLSLEARLERSGRIQRALERLRRGEIDKLNRSLEQSFLSGQAASLPGTVYFESIECPRCQGSGRLKVKRKRGRSKPKMCMAILPANWYRSKERPCARRSQGGTGFCWAHAHMAARILTGGI